MFTILWVSTATAIVVAFFCSLAEAVLLSLNPVRLETLRHAGHSHAEVWLEMKRNIARPIAAIVILNTIAQTGGATIAGGAFEDVYGAGWLWLFSLVFVVLVLFGTEILPKTLGLQYNERLAPWLVAPLQIAIGVLRPIVFLVEGAATKLRGRSETDPTAVRASDILSLARIARSRNLIAEEQEDIIANAMRLHELTVAAVMIPPESIVFLSTRLTPAVNLAIATANFHSRYPVSETDAIDGVVGYVNLKEILAAGPVEPAPSLTDFIRPILHVSAGTNLNAMLKLMVARHHHLAIVKDATGRVAGMVTLEDVVEEIIGDIEDEFDVPPAEIVPLQPGRWRVGGGVRLDALSHRIGVDLPAEPSDQTLAAWCRAQTDVSRPGQSFLLGASRITVQQVRRGVVHEAVVERG